MLEQNTEIKIVSKSEPTFIPPNNETNKFKVPTI